MSTITSILVDITIIILALVVITMIIGAVLFLRYDKKQKEHAVLRNYPLLGRVRYFFETIGPELRQYWFDNDTSGKPFSREEYQQMVRVAKYKSSIMSYGSKRDFNKEGYYIRNHMFPSQQEELDIDRDTLTLSKKYLLIKDPLFTERVEEFVEEEDSAYLLQDKDAVVIGENSPNPFIARGLIGMSGMSYGALGKNAITALSKGLGLAQGTWMNTGEGGLSPYHLEGGVDIIMQIGPAKFGVRDDDGNLDLAALREKAAIPQIKAFELKLAQGAKTRGGHIAADKVTEEIAQIRKVTPHQSVDSPNRFKEFDNPESMCDFIETIRKTTEKPVGIKIVVGGLDSVEPLAKYMKETGRGPDFITVDGSEGGTGASYQELMESVGLPIRSALPILNETLKKHGVRDHVKIIASAKMFAPDRIAIALAMGADLINIARGFMVSVGCIQTLRCHTNTCPTGVATTDPELEGALVVDEKKYRAANYVTTLRKGLFRLSAAAGLTSPVQFTSDHIMYKDQDKKIQSLTMQLNELRQKL